MQEKKKVISKIYTLSDNTGKDVFYVGFTKHEVSFRLMQHIQEAIYCKKEKSYKRGLNISKANKIASLNYDVLITIVEMIESDEKNFYPARRAEAKWILHYLDKGYTLLNKIKSPKEKSKEAVGYTFSSKKLNSVNKIMQEA